MDFSFSQGYVLLVVVFLVFALYREWFNPALTFFIATLALLLLHIAGRFAITWPTSRLLLANRHRPTCERRRVSVRYPG